MVELFSLLIIFVYFGLALGLSVILGFGAQCIIKRIKGTQPPHPWLH